MSRNHFSGRWIDCENRSPPHEKYVLTSVLFPDGRSFTMMGSYQGDNEEGNNTWILHQEPGLEVPAGAKVTHWATSPIREPEMWDRAELFKSQIKSAAPGALGVDVSVYVLREADDSITIMISIPTEDAR